MYTLRVLMLILIGLFALVSLSIADIPQRINYQGKLTDASGDPVADGNYEITFALYNDSLAGDKFWTESHPSVLVTDGLFNVVLGTTTPIPTGIIDTANVFLEITFNAETLQPRTRFVSVPYALAADKANALANESFLNETGDTLRGLLRFHGGTATGGVLDVHSSYANLGLADGGSLKAMLWGELYGEMGLWNPSDLLSVNLRAPSSGGGVLELYDTDGTSSVLLKGGPATDNNTLVQLPSGSVDDIELMNEPGIASNVNSAGIDLAHDVFSDVVTVSITIPAPGYIYLHGTCYLLMHPDVIAANGAFVQVNEDEGGSGIYIGSVRCFLPVSHPSDVRSPVSVGMVYHKETAGTYEFRIEAMEYYDSDGGVVAYGGQLTALYFPTSYGAVKTFVSNPGDNPEAIPVVIRDDDGNPTGETQYQVDLRYYELKAKQARIEALEAERDLQRARDAAARR